MRGVGRSERGSDSRVGARGVVACGVLAGVVGDFDQMSQMKISAKEFFSSKDLTDH